MYAFIHVVSLPMPTSSSLSISWTEALSSQTNVRTAALAASFEITRCDGHRTIVVPFGSGAVAKSDDPPYIGSLKDTEKEDVCELR
jgi:hypothetical protein